MKFQLFPALNDQHEVDYNNLANLPFSGNYAKVHKVVENAEEQEALK